MLRLGYDSLFVDQSFTRSYGRSNMSTDIEFPSEEEHQLFRRYERARNGEKHGSRDL